MGERGGKTGLHGSCGPGVYQEVQESWEALIGSHGTDVLGLLWLPGRKEVERTWLK